MNLQQLCEVLEECSADYFKLGIQLGLDYPQLKKIETYKGDCSQGLWIMLQTYAYDMSSDVEEVCRAVGRVGRKDLENKFRDEKYKGKRNLHIFILV